MLFSENFFNDCSNAINIKIEQISKKMQNVEHNINNKLKILKESLKDQVFKNSEKEKEKLKFSKNKEKIANFEIKIKILEESLNQIKEKLKEKEKENEKILKENEKTTKNYLKIKNEQNLLIGHINDLKEKINQLNKMNEGIKLENNSEKTVIQLNENNKEKEKVKEKQKTKQNSLKSLQIQFFSNFFNILYFENFNNKSNLEKFVSICNFKEIFLLFMENPLNLFSKFPESIYFMSIYLQEAFLNKNTKLINDLTVLFIKNKLSSSYFGEDSLISFTFEEKDESFNEPFIKKIDFLLNYLSKNQKKYQNTKIYQCCLNLMILFLTDLNIFLDTLNEIINIIIFETNNERLIIDLKIIEILIHLFENKILLHFEEEIFFTIIQMFLFIYSKSKQYNNIINTSFILNKLSNSFKFLDILFNFLKSPNLIKKQENLFQILIFSNIFSKKYPFLFKNKLNFQNFENISLNNNKNFPLITENIKSILFNIKKNNI